ncbi:beta 1-4 rhamnosyltransferase Cps2T [Streptococcus sp. zg-JUN1979]|uniref:beta 1-4 rhamnosyltransferase Cps2T n=1 Tax=Streptococcus sp. zg-JUN1979 TaxID=3391450 RepID=UPI0039A4632A
MQHVFIIGSRGLPATYGGFETFVEELVKNQKSDEIRYHVACLSDKEHGKHYEYEGADCFQIKVSPKLGPSRVIFYDMMAINYALKLCRKEKIEAPIFYILGNTIGAFISHFVRKVHAYGGKVFVNPDGLEWKRSKWAKPVQAYLKYAEKKMAEKADLIIADNVGIKEYIKASYPRAKIHFIAYGTQTTPSSLISSSEKVRQVFTKWGISEHQYYLIVGRFVPENNYKLAIREFMASQTTKDLVIICNHQGSAYFEQLQQETGFDKDKRIKFVGTVYDRDFLTYIRQNAFAYIHGHEVGGTNPGLLEALSHTKLNLVLDVSFNRSVARDSSLYWQKERGVLSRLIDNSDHMVDVDEYAKKAQDIISKDYTWDKIVGEYEELLLS